MKKSKNTPQNHILTLNKCDAYELITELNFKALGLFHLKKSSQDIFKIMIKEIRSLQAYFKLEEPYNKPIEEKDFNYIQSIIQFDKKNLIAYVADIYMKEVNNIKEFIINTEDYMTQIKQNAECMFFHIDTQYKGIDY